MTLFTHLLVSHLIADWIFQNDWIAKNKTNLKHPALYVHGLIHFVVMMVITQNIIPALPIAVIHILIDTRSPLKWWMGLYRQTTEGVYAIHVQIWLDQVFHIVTIYMALLVFSH